MLTNTTMAKEEEADHRGTNTAERDLWGLPKTEPPITKRQFAWIIGAEAGLAFAVASLGTLIYDRKTNKASVAIPRSALRFAVTALAAGTALSITSMAGIVWLGSKALGVNDLDGFARKMHGLLHRPNLVEKHKLPPPQEGEEDSFRAVIPWPSEQQQQQQTQAATAKKPKRWLRRTLLGDEDESESEAAGVAGPSQPLPNDGSRRLPKKEGQDLSWQEFYNGVYKSFGEIAPFRWFKRSSPTTPPSATAPPHANQHADTEQRP
ncbi:hypothetical protein QOT17_011966 [Balamuthia mandrillaris]